MPEMTSSTPWSQRLQQLRTERSSFESQWREIAENMAPGRLRLETFTEYNKGQKKHQKIIDETVLRARRTFVAGFVSGMTSPARPWFKLITPDAELNETHGVRVWMDEVERRIGLILARSNFYHAIPRLYDDMGTFGTGAMTVMEDEKNLVWFYPHSVGGYWTSQNDQGIVDVIYRETVKTVAQLIDTFGIENVSDQTRALFRNHQTEKRVECYNAIEPNDDRDVGKLDFGNMPFRSVWWEKGHKNNQYLGIRGFEEFPAVVGRWYTSLDDYGVDCPGMTSLGPVKQLHHEQTRKAQAIDKMVNPPMQAPASLKRGNQINLLPGGINYYDEASGGAGLRPLYERDPRINELLLDIQEVQNRINETWYVDMFLMLSNEQDVRTATEVVLRNEEKLLALGPVLTRIQTEVLDPVIDRVFNIMARTGNLPEIPPELEGVDLRVKYISMLAQAQQSVGASSIERLINAGATAANTWGEEALDVIDIDETLREYNGIIGAPARLIRSREAVDERRTTRQQAQQAQQMAELANTAAQAAKTGSEVNVSQDSAIDRLTQ